MKIAYIVRNYHKRGGISGYTSVLAEKFCKGDDVHVFASSFEDLNVSITAHKVAMITLAILKKMKKYSWNVALEVPSFMAGSAKLVSKDKFDIIHSQGDYNGKCDIYTAHSCHKAWLEIAKNNKTGWLDGLKKSVYNPLHYWILKGENSGVSRSKRIIAISEVVKREFIRYYPDSANKIEVIYNGVETERFNPALAQQWRKTIRNKYALKENDTVVIFPAHEFKRKGLVQIIDAFYELKAENIYLLVVGRDDPSGYEDAINRKGLTKKIIFAGEQANIEQYYAAADIMVFPTLYEPFGLVVTEAMASGLPVLVSSLAGAAELIKDNINGILLKDRNDIKELSGKLKWLIANKVARLEIGNKARAAVLNYTWDKIAAETRKLYETVQREKQINSKLKVCMFGRSLPAHAMGGMELHTETLSRELAALGHDVTLITTGNPSGVSFENKEGVKIHYLQGTMPGKYSAGYFKQSELKFIELNDREKFD